jgi:hypothetical protein
MISEFIGELKASGIPPQLDLGTFTVGIATMMVAFVSLFVALRSTRASNNQRIAEFRQEWIDDLRQHVSQFVGATYEILNHTLSSVEGADRQRELDIKHSELKQLESFIAMKLNSHELDHRILVKLLAHTRGRAAAFSLNSGSDLAVEIDRLIDLITDFSKLIYKVEWDRVRDETYGRGRTNRYLRNLVRQWNRQEREAAVRARASTFFGRPENLSEGAI